MLIDPLRQETERAAAALEAAGNKPRAAVEKVAAALDAATGAQPMAEVVTLPTSRK